jgi:hypothetical protein
MVATTTSKQPEAYIAVKGNRQKIYSGSEIYLNDGTEFQIELFNPTQSTVAAKIHINGKAISESMVVIKPGSREYLDRFLDRNNKFLFETYNVDDTQEVRDAIAHNGIVKVEFYNELIEIVSNTYTYVGTGNPTVFPTISTPPIGTTGDFWFGTNTDHNALFSCTSDSLSLNEFNLTSSSGSKSIETGRVESGSKSDQKFDTYNGRFAYLPFVTYEYKVLPSSTKPIEVSQIRNYCTGCGNRIRKSSWQFCPGCGEKL